MYGMGCAAGDYDNDGDSDLYVACLGANRLFRNRGGGRFEDVTVQMGVGDSTWSVCAVWLDYDRDGDLDLFVGNYLQWSAARDDWLSARSSGRSYAPQLYDPGVLPALPQRRQSVLRTSRLHPESAKSRERACPRSPWITTATDGPTS